MIESPVTYAEWIALLTELKERENSQEILNALQKGELSWQTGVAERFVSKLYETVNFRMNMAIKKFQSDISRCVGEHEIIGAIIALKKEIKFNRNIIELPTLPTEQKEKLRSIFIEQVDEIQNSLEKSSKGDTSGKLQAIIRNHKVND